MSRHGLTETGFGMTAEQIRAAADELFKSGLLAPATDPVSVMVTVTKIIKAAYRVRPHFETVERDIEEAIKRKVMNGR